MIGSLRRQTYFLRCLCFLLFDVFLVQHAKLNLPTRMIKYCLVLPILV